MQKETEERLYSNSVINLQCKGGIERIHSPSFLCFLLATHLVRAEKTMDHGRGPGESFPAKKKKLEGKYNIQLSVGKEIF